MDRRLARNDPRQGFEAVRRAYVDVLERHVEPNKAHVLTV
jgi:hypothetical protein